MFTHQDALTEAEFVKIDTNAGSTLRASPGHYVWAVPRAIHTLGTQQGFLNHTSPLALTGMKVCISYDKC